MTEHYADATVRLLHGDCLDVLREIPDASVDAVCTDPPYGLEFMGKTWDAPWRDGAASRGAVIVDPATERGGFQDGNGGNPYSRSRIEYGRGGAASVGFQQWCELWAAECLRVLKPGGHMLAFGGTRTWHRLTCAVEDAGFEIRDSIAWMYGSGFPKSLDVSKAIDKAAGATREVGTLAGRSGSGRTAMDAGTRSGDLAGDYFATAPATDDARTWQGWGTALKPAFEPVVVARKPLSGTVAANVLTHGTGALNVDACRIEGQAQPFGNGTRRTAGIMGASEPRGSWESAAAGRWPANVVLDESQAAELDTMSGESGGGPTTTEGSRSGGIWTESTGKPAGPQHGDRGGASRFFYTAKAGSDERIRVNGTAHPTVKPLSLMRWLVRLVTPLGGTVLEPFAGSGTTVEACILEGFRCVAIEREADYLPLIMQRIHRRRDPVAYTKGAGDDGGLFDLLDDGGAA